MKKLLSFFTVLFLLSSLIPKTSSAQAISDWFEMPFEWFVECANDGEGEFVVGTLHMHLLLNSKKNGEKIHYQPAGGILIGQETGDVYHTVGVTQSIENINLSPLGYVVTFINNMNVIGEGNAANFRAHEQIHVTINAFGIVKVEFENHKITCDNEVVDCPTCVD